MKKRGKEYITPTGYVIRIQRGGYGAENSFRPRTNDFKIEPLIEEAMAEACRWGTGWTDQETAQEVLDSLAVEHGWSERPDKLERNW